MSCCRVSTPIQKIMQRITKQLEKISRSGHTGLMTHTVAGCPDLEFSKKVILQMVQSGADFVEIQIPFSDPVADGPVMMGANELALANGIRVQDVFKLAKQVTQSVEVPIFFMGYFNTIFKMGIQEFCKKAKAAGIAGLIFPDIPFDEGMKESFLQECQRCSLAPIQVVSENTQTERLLEIAKIPGDLIYCQSRFGTTGVGKNFSENLSNFLHTVRQTTGKKIAVGFGISTPEDVQHLGQQAEIAVIGSGLMKITLDETLSESQKLKKVGDLVSSLKLAK